MKQKQQFAVLGLGLFGTVLATELFNLGHDVLVVDSNEELINSIANKVTHAIQADITNENSLKSLGLSNFNQVIVTVSESIQTSLLACMILKEQGIKSLVAKAKTDLHGKLLQKIGVDKIIFPEKDMAIKIAKSITTSSIIDYIELTRGLSVAELEIPEHLEGKTLQETDLRSRYGLTVLAIISPDKTNLEPTAGDKIEKGDIMVVVGKKEAVSNIDFK